MPTRALGVVAIVAIAVPGCGFATAPMPSTAFSLDAGNYTLKLAGTGLCSSGTDHEGSAPVIVSRSGAVWSIKPVQPDDFAMTLTTDGAAAGSVRGETGGGLTSASGLEISAPGQITGANAGADLAGGAILSPVTFQTANAASVCLSGVWTLTK
ncbi:MAG: hypothetical protein EPO35_05405 [Acidobacteria bacterium]|nr:MAG: hypothetical protein EPO35_05405 [Acidobacteriota bacterium]